MRWLPSGPHLAARAAGLAAGLWWAAFGAGPAGLGGLHSVLWRWPAQLRFQNIEIGF
jgi:hypothetical protein